MPLYWKYLIKTFLKYFLGSNLAFITVLLVTRLEDIAKVAAYGAPLSTLGFYTLLQIPYMLPIVLPLSTLIASFLLFSQWSKTHEINAFRSSGMSIWQLLLPLLWLCSILGALNFFIASELATSSHLKSRQISSQLSQLNPLLILQDKKLLRYQNAYVEMLAGVHKDHIENLIICAYHDKNDTLNLIRAKKLLFKKPIIQGEKISLVNIFKSDHPQDFNHLIIENQDSIHTPLHHMETFIRPSHFRLSNDHLQLNLLLVKRSELKDTLPLPYEEIQQVQSEITRRLSLGLAPLSFCLLGSTFAIRSQRQAHRRSFYLLCLLTSFFLILFFMAKNMDKSFFKVSSLHIVAHLSLWFFSWRNVQKLHGGKL